MVYILVLIANLGAIDSNVYTFGPEFVTKEHCEQFAKQLLKTKNNYHLCLPIK